MTGVSSGRCEVLLAWLLPALFALDWSSPLVCLAKVNDGCLELSWSGILLCLAVLAENSLERGLVKVSAGGRMLSFSKTLPVTDGLLLSEEDTTRSSATLVETPELPPALVGNPSRMAYSSASACFSVQQPCQQFLQSQTRNWKQNRSILRQG